MAIDIWVSTILKLGFVIAAVHLTLTRIIPMLQDFLSAIIKEKKVLDSLTSLIGILVLVLAGKEILVFVQELNNGVLNYLLTLNPALAVLSNLIFYLQWVIIAVFVVMLLKAYKAGK